MKNKITMDRLAQMTAREFGGVHADMAKQSEQITELSGRTARLEEEMKLLRRDTESGFQDVISALRQLREDIAAIDFGPEVHDLQNRVGQIEKKLATQ
jgi:cell division protein FtsB